MQELSPEQLKKLKKLERVAKVLDGGNVAMVTEFFKLEDSIQAKVDSIENGVDGVDGRDGIDGERGDKGEKGDKGDKGDKGERGERGKDGVNGVDGKDGEMGVIDVATIGYLEDEIKQAKSLAKNNMRDGIGLVVRQLQAGNNISIDNTNQEYPIITATVTGGSGISRSIVVTVGNTTLGATADTDYVCVVNGAHTITMPTAVGNTNQYTIKNNHSADITVDTTSLQTIDGTTTIQIAPEDSVDIVSTNTNWVII
jgi:hypothetical protein